MRKEVKNYNNHEYPCINSPLIKTAVIKPAVIFIADDIFFHLVHNTALHYTLKSFNTLYKC